MPGSQLHPVLLKKRCVGLWGALLGGVHMRGDALWQVGLVDLLNLMLVKVDFLWLYCATGRRILRWLRGFSEVRSCLSLATVQSKCMRCDKQCKTPTNHKPPHSVVQVMRLCWATVPEDRPGFRPIKEQLSSIAQTLELQIQWPGKTKQLVRTLVMELCMKKAQTRKSEKRWDLDISRFKQTTLGSNLMW